MSSDLQTRLTEAEKSFKKACEQIVQLNRRLDEMAKRYDRASRENHRSFRYSHRLRMAVTEGVRNMYYEYAANKADEITNLRCQVLQEVGDGNQAPVEGQEDENRAEEDGDGDEINPIADFEEVGETDSRMSSNSRSTIANDDSVMQLEDNEDNSSEEVQEPSSVIDEEFETDDTYVAVSSLNSEPEEDMDDVTNCGDHDGGNSRHTALTSSSQSSSSSSL